MDALEKIDKDEDASDSEDNQARDMFKKKRGDKETLAEEEARIKDEFKKAHKQDDGSGGEEDDFFVKRAGQEDQDDSSDNGNNQKRKGGKEMNMQSDTDILNSMYGGELSKTDKFLRNYIFNEGWKDKKNNKNDDDDHYQEY